MASWLIPASTKFYDVFLAFERSETYWPMNAKVATGDIVYIYLAAPYKQIGFRSKVLGIGYDLAEILDQVRPLIKGDVDHGSGSKPFMKLGAPCAVPIDPNAALSLNNLREHGLKGMLMGARKLDNNLPLLEFTEKAFK